MRGKRVTYWCTRYRGSRDFAIVVYRKVAYYFETFEEREEYLKRILPREDYIKGFGFHRHKDCPTLYYIRKERVKKGRYHSDYSLRRLFEPKAKVGDIYNYEEWRR